MVKYETIYFFKFENAAGKRHIEKKKTKLGEGVLYLRIMDT